LRYLSLSLAMATTLLQARPYDPRRERRKRIILISAFIAVLALAFLAWWFWNWPYERTVGNFLEALKQQQYEKAYGIWMADAQWKEHPDRHSRYPFNEFYTDWGPGGEWGLIKSYRVEGSVTPPKTGYRSASGVVVAATINERVDKACIWVEKSDRTLSFSPYECR
jgi:hypothetical protein